MVCATSKASDQPAQSDQSLGASLDYSMSVELLTEHNLDFLSLKAGCTGSSESTLLKCHTVGNHMSRLIFKLDTDKISIF